jgi:hypothetical protein
MCTVHALVLLLLGLQSLSANMCHAPMLLLAGSRALEYPIQLLVCHMDLGMPNGLSRTHLTLHLLFLSYISSGSRSWLLT